MNNILCFVFAVFAMFPMVGVNAQVLADTNIVRNQSYCERKFTNTPGYNILKCALPMFAASAMSISFDKRLKETRDFGWPTYKYKYDDYLQYAPLITKYGMKIGGVDGKATWGQMLTADVISAATMAAIVNGLKYSVKRMRPDNSKRNSFPSGHSATAFMAATMLQKEYGHISPWVSFAAYTPATLVAVSRMLNNRHWMSDVLFGAGVGIASVELGCYLSDLIFKNHTYGVVSDNKVDYSAVSSYIEYSVAYSALMAPNYNVDGVAARGYYGISSSVSGAYLFNSGWGIGGTVNMMSALLTKDAGMVGATQYMTGPEYSMSLIPRLFWNAKVHVGVGTNLFNQEPEELVFTSLAGTSLLWKVSGTFGVRAYANFVLTPYQVRRNTNYFSSGLSVCMLID